MTKKKVFGMKWLAAVCLLSVCMSSASAKNGADDVGQPGTPIDDNGGNGGGSDDVGFDDKGGNTPGDDNGGSAGGNGSGGGNGASDQRLRLRIGNDRTNEFSSKVEYRVKKGLARIKGTVKLWLPDVAGTGLDSATAPNALITATFVRGAPYAECEFTFNRIVDGRVADTYSHRVRPANCLHRGSGSKRAVVTSISVPMACRPESLARLPTTGWRLFFTTSRIPVTSIWVPGS
jgi:hypothetical protein